LQEQVTALQASLEGEKHQVACLTDELEKKQETPHAPPKFTTKLSSVSLVPTASSSRATAGTLVPETFKMLQPMPSLSRVTIDLTKEEDCDNILDHRGVTPDYDMEFGSNEELLKGEVLERSRTLASIPQGAKHQGKVQRLAQDEIEAELSQLRKDYMAHCYIHVHIRGSRLDPIQDES
jgi:hypothetical protein